MERDYIYQEMTRDLSLPFFSTCLDAESSALSTVHLETAQDGSAGPGLHGPRSAGHVHLLPPQRHVLFGYAHLRSL
ncbi:hypothetical protein TNCT_728921 [Trichonephila clavata]|uniref:Uncharacterized protein n=1 Tax=Trichonephila clavata TaxID=2740835 RepID=A0A8X6GW66_TRICU|nr:hypothetical protein TNCT_728921 [Trichonephila clavata]